MSHNSIATGGLDRRPAPAVIPIVLYSTGPLKEPGIFYFPRGQRAGRGSWGAVVFGRWKRYAPCVLTKDLPPLRFLYSE